MSHSIDGFTACKNKILEIELEIQGLQGKIKSKGRRKSVLDQIVRKIRAGEKVSDLFFDQIYPWPTRKMSDTHWTPVEVAVQAAKLLGSSEKTRILDVGSGCGKFCSVAGLSSPAQFVGVEQREHLYTVACNIADELGLENVSFNHGNMTDMDWSDFDGFYLFNPFFENRLESIRIDDTVLCSQKVFESNIKVVRKNLNRAKCGTKVLTYHGFGGEMPASYRCQVKSPIATSFLELWVKSSKN